MKHLRQLDLNLLVIFEALISECHVSRAAERLHLSQSATSHALGRLRELLDDPLLVRTGQGLQATPRAAQMLPQVRQALSLVEQSLSPSQFNPATDQRHFTLACNDYFETVLFPNWMSQLQQQAPGISVDIEVISESSYQQALASGELDLIIEMNSERTLSAELIRHPWFSEPQVCLCNEQQAIDSSLTLEQYLALPQVLFFDSLGDSSSAVDNWLLQQGKQRHAISRTTNYLAGARLAANSNAIITLPEQMAKLFCQWLPLKTLAPPSGLPAVKLSIVQHALYASDPAIGWLLEQLMSLHKQ